ncbi:hypothetical protein NKH18_50380 [Streptomyces sp. M10(2022)]
MVAGAAQCETALHGRRRCGEPAAPPWSGRGGRPGIARSARGLPLALALFAGAEADASRSPGTGPVSELRDAPELVSELLRLLLRETPSLDQADALNVLAIARVTTEELVRHALEIPAAEARALCAWLRGCRSCAVPPRAWRPTHWCARRC